MRKSEKKETLLTVAEQLFYSHGFHGVGLKQIIQEANVANMTLYNHFNSKEHLVEEVLKRREERYWEYLDNHVCNVTTNPFIAVVEAHGKWLEEHSYQGDMFLRAIEDYGNTNETIAEIARSHKNRLLNYLQGLAKKLGLHEELDVSLKIILILEGATSMTTLIGANKATEYSLSIASDIVTKK